MLIRTGAYENMRQFRLSQQRTSNSPWRRIDVKQQAVFISEIGTVERGRRQVPS